ncbi:MAG: IMP dehydrogenase [Candidatus Chisholmbacteria bacterium RIFCSPHIGHO2_01_FULL_49_18]|uniref:IMP dehydrogenase n=2 Tax=Candidatus Chisholmiibacteriota TaxID=1817900 RepID=A0A1G1VLT5_9BACT|nr:MAG: IMP dehydrogenase [Candidatus Chisholmbacteria bacterium RIFCSPHIGHO2_01_FULL_49_18]OGY21821.1 MAG: IMP dehydrogenase [Candidatus Chisholmbacteria bacterium RIFCSPLOWO2_01_FULL_49_14]
MAKPIPLALTYDDVLLIPRRSRIQHRADVNTATLLTDSIKLQIPFVSANMDTVTEGKLAIAMARAGGIGIIHRFMSIEDEVHEVDAVKRYEGFVIDNPFTVRPDKPLRHVLEKITTNAVSSYLVVEADGKLLGLITRRDIILEQDQSKPVRKVMTPFSKLITAKPGVTPAQAKKIFITHKIEKLPLIDHNGKLKGLITARSIVNFEQNPLATKDGKGRLRTGAAVGVVGDFLERAEALLAAGCDVIVVDAAHGQNLVTLSAIGKLRKKFPDAQIIGGNVATAAGARDLVKAGVDALKVGIGPGGICSTRIVTGVGVPQLTAIMDCTKAVKGRKVKVIADGGTNYPGDVSKALAAGASSIMLAGWFAGTEESPGEIIIRNNRRYKIHRGSASFLSQADRAARTGSNTLLNTIVPEGVESLIEYKGSVAEIIHQLLGSLRSGMSYCDAASIKELQKNAKFVRMTSAGFRESQTHNVNEI